MSDAEHLVIFSQLLLANDVRVVEAAASLLKNLVEFNSTINSKLYLTGAFFFICRFPGNNFISLAKLLEVTHLNQSFHDSVSAISRFLLLSLNEYFLCFLRTKM